MLVACGDGVVMPGGAGGGAGAADGEANRLDAGMTEAEVLEKMGPENGFERNPVNLDQTCLSFNYGSEAAPRYVHALMERNVLVRATDGHGALCTFEAGAAGQA
ncbi:hypothetical protein [Cognatishimia sp. F0-27]|uniref:hypothetical protein n=1 Tax=Cognatishimia sp. F0-27 TaxID=2816855 RepID=UPI001D0C279B|nr:hypothetical protein [Cognatishimia sp. F0-27]MCC1494354.1 hypothetical protein [Cognatishimia sp. F0-27]